ncbi:MAG: glycosyltransferase [Elusimicrobia bacterium]|nr:glycosyltransferase [Elusimicrobiota bacterium]
MISLLAPAYNEEDVIREFVRSIYAKVSLQEDWELIIVDDGSMDRTGAILKELAGEHPNLRVVTHARNQNLGGALKSGIAAAKGRIIVTMDADCAHPPELIGAMTAALANADVCAASRFVPGGGMLRVPIHRRAMSRLANFLYRVFFLSPVKDNTGGFKAYNASLLKSVAIEEHGFAVQLEIMTKLIANKARFTEIPFVLTNRDLGISKLNYVTAVPGYLKRVLILLIQRWS